MTVVEGLSWPSRRRHWAEMGFAKSRVGATLAGDGTFGGKLLQK